MAIIPDFKNASGLWVKSVGTAPDANDKTESYTKWKNVRTRCTFGSAAQGWRRNYMDCTMSETFKNFQTFTDWHTQQIGYAVGYHIDKDLLFHGNKYYSEHTCVLIPKQLNTFLCFRGNDRGELPIGVSLQKHKHIKANVSVGGRQVVLGSFDTVEAAYSAYKAAKEAEARRWYERLVAGEFLVDPRVIERMRTWTLPEGL